MIRIVQLPVEALVALAAGDLDAANAHSPVPLTQWLVSPEAIGTWKHRARQVFKTPSDLPWITGVLRDDAQGLTVGKAGFHAAPDASGMVEVGYAVDPACRRRGYGSAALSALIARARATPTIWTLRASIAPHNTASLALLRPYAFVQTGEQWDEEDGQELIYELRLRA